MELIEKYLQDVQKVGGIYLLQVPADTSVEEYEHIHDMWQRMRPDDDLFLMPKSFNMSHINRYSFYVALMIIRTGKKVTRAQWVRETEGYIQEAPYLTFSEEDHNMLVRKFPNNPSENEFFFIGQEDVDAEDYMIVP